MAAPYKNSINTDTLALILADQGHLEDARSMLNHLQRSEPSAKRVTALRQLDNEQLGRKVARLEALLLHIRQRAQQK
ncbi:MAG: hypothetical protein OSB21_13215 [Myxococcota bacterium]|nr:hypothetical protein [Myxococcota bacterium]